MRSGHVLHRHCSLELRWWSRNWKQLALKDKCSRHATQPQDNGTGNVFAPLNAVEGRNYTDFTFYLRSFPVAGQWYSCYCATFDNNDQFTCNYELEYYQEHASLIVRGPTVQVLPCVQAQNCTVQVEGFGLSADDRVQICPFNETHPCSHGELCARVGPEARTGLLSPASSTENATSFDFGVVPIGSYSLCYCATGRNASHPSAISCGAAADLTMGAGELNVRGATPGQIHSCVEGSACAFVVTGHGLASTDHVLLAPLDEACGDACARARAHARVGGTRQRALCLNRCVESAVLQRPTLEKREEQAALRRLPRRPGNLPPAIPAGSEAAPEDCRVLQSCPTLRLCESNFGRLGPLLSNFWTTFRRRPGNFGAGRDGWR